MSTLLTRVLRRAAAATLRPDGCPGPAGVTSAPQFREHASPRAAAVERLETRALLAGQPTPDMVLAWNTVLCDTIRADTTQPGPTPAARNMAVVHLAMFDALNGIKRECEPFLVKRRAPAGSSPLAAVASAAYESLRRVYPEQQSALAAEFEESLATLGKKGKAAGVKYGAFVARKIVATREGDGSDEVVQYAPQPGAGHWRPDPLNPGQTAWGPGEGAIRPFVIEQASDFDPPSPPALTSAEYAAAFDEVKSLGAKDSTTRTADQTEIGIFWAYDRSVMGPPPVLYNQNLQEIATQQGNTMAENARLFALANVAQADAGIVAWDCKFKDDLWRPITGVREADTDGNPATTADPDWVPLGAPGGGVVEDFTPPFPAYISGHATFGAAIFRTLEHFYGTDDVSYTLMSDELPGVTRSFDSFSQAAEENGRSRIYLGIHWSFDDTEGRACGAAIADHVFAGEMQPLKKGAKGG